MPRIVRLGDPTDHGGAVVQTSAPNFKVNGVAVARKGDRCSCPRNGHHDCVIIEGDEHFKVDGVPVPGIGMVEIVAVLAGGSLIAAVVSLALWRIERRANHGIARRRISVLDRTRWTMPPLEQLTAARLTPLKRTWMLVLRGYLVIAAGLVLVRIAGLVAG